MPEPFSVAQSALAAAQAAQASAESIADALRLQTKQSVVWQTFQGLTSSSLVLPMLGLGACMDGPPKRLRLVIMRMPNHPSLTFRSAQKLILLRLARRKLS